MRKLRYRPRFKAGERLIHRFGGRLDIPVLVLAREGHYGAWEYRVLAASKFDRVLRLTVPERSLRKQEGGIVSCLRVS